MKKKAKFDRNTIGQITITVTKNTAAAPIPAKQSFRIGGDDGSFVFEPVGPEAANERAKERAERTLS